MVQLSLDFNPTPTKRCAKCKEYLPLAEFSSRPDRKSGVRSRCKPCNALTTKNYFHNTEKKDALRLRRKDDPAIHGINGYNLYRCRCEICVTARREYNLHYRNEHRRHLNALARARDANMPLARREVELRKKREAMRKYAQEHPDRVKDIDRRSHRKYNQTEKAKRNRLVFKHAYRARKQNAPGRATSEQIQARWDIYGGRCWMCSQPATEIDHVIPLSKGGTNWPSNLRPACKPCNSGKGARRNYQRRSG